LDVSARPFALTALALALAGTAGAAEAGSSSLRFTFAPNRVFQGQDARLTVAVRPAGTRCALALAYAGGRRQPGLKPVAARAGKASWRWKVATDTPVGSARATVSCGRAGRGSRALRVVRATPIPASVRVEKHGFSERTRGLSTTVSYGVVLVNPSPDKDAKQVMVQVNFVDAQNRVLNSPVTRVPTIGAGATYYLGGSASLPVGGSVARLEPIVQVGSRVERSHHVPPTADVRFLPNRFDPEWVGTVAGQVLNDHRSRGLSRAGVSVVLFDAAGNVVGGTMGFAGGAVLPPGGRVFWQAQVGLDAVPWSKTAAVQVSVDPTWQ
jgi:hypothetical protein